MCTQGYKYYMDYYGVTAVCCYSKLTLTVVSHV